jgi:hypothetical protein
VDTKSSPTKCKRLFRNSMSAVQLIEQDLGLFQIKRVEAFRKPAVVRCLRSGLPDRCSAIFASVSSRGAAITFSRFY